MNGCASPGRHNRSIPGHAVPGRGPAAVASPSRLPKALAALMLLIGLIAAEAAARQDPPGTGRFFFCGDGHIHLISEKNSHLFAGRYRTGRDAYDPAALKAICRVFDAPYGPQGPGVSPRLIEFIDYLQDKLSPGGRITITSGYRDPQYNTSLRNRGRLAAKASLHQYGMAADLKLQGAPARRIWDYVKALNFGGAGYYHGQTVHVDVGPARSWDETTSGVGTGISDDNKLIGLVTDYDRYLPSEPVTLRFIRMTAFPIGVSAEFTLERLSDPGAAEQVTLFKPSFIFPNPGECPQFGDIAQMDAIGWQIPQNLAPGRWLAGAGSVAENLRSYFDQAKLKTVVGLRYRKNYGFHRRVELPAGRTARGSDPSRG